MCFPVNFEKFLRTPFLQNTSGRLLPNKIYKFVRKEDILNTPSVGTPVVLTVNNLSEAEVYSGTCNTSMVEFFLKVIN